VLTREQVLGARRMTDIFGPNATESRRALRKAYADLVKVFSPERDPECFRRVRDAYEVLNANFDLGSPDAPLILDGGSFAVAGPTGMTSTDPGARSREPSRYSSGGPSYAGQQADRVRDAELSLEASAALLKQGDAVGALARLDACETQVRPMLAQEWTELMLEALAGAALELPIPRLERALDEIDDPQVEISDGTYWYLCSRCVLALAWCSAKDDPGLPQAFRDALHRSQGLDRWGLARIWFDTLESLGTSAFVSSYERIVEVHPGLLPELYRIEEVVTGVATFMSKWEFGQPALELSREQTTEIKALQGLRAAVWAQHRPAVEKDNDQKNFRIAAVVAGLVGCVLLWSNGFGLQGWFAVALALTLALRGRAKSLSKGSSSSAATLRERCFEFIRSSGLFRHEVLSAVTAKRVPEHVEVGEGFFGPDLIDPLVEIERQPPTGLALLSRAQLRRIFREAKASGTSGAPA
jgi:hypothetical protein